MSKRLNTAQMTLRAPITPGSPVLVGSRPGLGRPLTAADVLTALEVAELLHVPKSTVEDWARRGIVPSRKVGRRRLYVRWRIEALLLDEDASP